jgi:hypothetical protein
LKASLIHCSAFWPQNPSQLMAILRKKFFLK